MFVCVWGAITMQLCKRFRKSLAAMLPATTGCVEALTRTSMNAQVLSVAGIAGCNTHPTLNVVACTSCVRVKESQMRMYSGAAKLKVPSSLSTCLFSNRSSPMRKELPKSPNFQAPPTVRNTFSLLMSRCTIPWADIAQEVAVNSSKGRRDNSPCCMLSVRHNQPSASV